jgi:predicted dehydrogenase
VNKEFLDWLTDPVQNGGGAVTDFGCYGVNLLTWLTKGARPLSVTALTQQIKPETYPQVDDEATLLLAYPSAQGIIQASWNWPFSRKDLEVYGKSGYAIAETGSKIRYRLAEDQPEAVEELPAKSYPYDDPYGYLAGVIRGSVTPEPYALSSLENNLIVVEILDAAIRSARTGQRIALVAPGPAKQNPNKK